MPNCNEEKPIVCLDFFLNMLTPIQIVFDSYSNIFGEQNMYQFFLMR